MSTFPPPQGYQTNPVILHEVAFAGAATLDTGELLTKDVLARTELFYEDDAGTQTQLTSNGKINTAAMAIGTADQVLATNHTATGIEYKTLTPGTNIAAITGAAGTLTITGSTAPSITDFTSAAHNHTNAAGGAQITDAALSAAVGLGKGGTGMTSTGAANQIAGMVAVPGGMEWKSFANGTGITVVHTANTITITNTLPGVTDHGLLDATSLTHDDHTQYALLPGRAGGQIGYGSNLAGENLTLSATSHGTPGSIYLCATGTTPIATVNQYGLGILTGVAVAGTNLFASQSYAGNLYWKHTNSNAGTATAIMQVSSDTANIWMVAYSSGFASHVNEVSIQANSASMLSVGTGAGAAPLVFMTGASYNWYIHSDGCMTLGYTATVGSNLPFLIKKAFNSGLQCQVTNTTDGTAASSLFYVQCGTTGVSSAVLFAVSDTFTPAEGKIAGDCGLYTDNALALSLVANAAIPIRFVTSATEKMRLLSGGTLCINATSAIGTEKLYVNGGVNISDTGNLTWAGALKNIRIGNTACIALTSGTYNVAIGESAMGVGIVTGADNIAIGQRALEDATSAATCIAIGKSAGLNLTTAADCVAIGYLAMGAGIVTGAYNVAMGRQVLEDVTSGALNLALVKESLSNLTTGSNNVAIGAAITAGIVTGADNIGIGQDSLDILTSGADNIGIGRNAGVLVTTGANNTYLGALAGSTGASAAILTKSCAIGYNALVSASSTMVLGGTGADILAVVVGATAAFGTEMMYVVGGLRNTLSAWLGCPTAAPADATLQASQVTFWVDEALNLLTFKVKYAGGTVKSGTAALT